MSPHSQHRAPRSRTIRPDTILLHFYSILPHFTTLCCLLLNKLLQATAAAGRQKEHCLSLHSPPLPSPPHPPSPFPPRPPSPFPHSGLHQPEHCKQAFTASLRYHTAGFAHDPDLRMTKQRLTLTIAASADDKPATHPPHFLFVAPGTATGAAVGSGTQM
ncbi:hypothetical protein AOQ84DRAFT_167058 [Glonium stellatum]|uniref:Uncharacterized protein n=1 Tax=Glonium stellatum TaxID=574774 RepID=A0A8E2EQ80_9PEZI|nr:hypothetical protein AOQ84DRAFT_167058 [Glonium stellatum]